MQKQYGWAKQSAMTCFFAGLWGLCAAGTALAQTTVYWGGGTTNKVGSSTLAPSNGTWSTSIANWGDVSSGTANFSAWDNTMGNTASFGARTVAQTITIPAVTNMVGGLSTYVFDGTASVTIQGNSSASLLNITNGATINVATGTVLIFQPERASL